MRMYIEYLIYKVYAYVFYCKNILYYIYIDIIRSEYL